MVQGWMDLFRRILSRNHEFVSEDARRLSNDHRAYEMLSGTAAGNLKVPESALTSPKETYPTYRDASSYPETSERMNPLAQNSPTEYYGHDAKTYISPSTSFSSPRPPSSAANPNKGWDPQSTYAKGNRFY